ncbi:neuraminidase-like domain-containing protein [Streptomyces sp. NPDC050416]|uniref:Tc toxin subunit A-related protein n=1 Tax=Streptomyces sp. NPDC050416 TaxID=3365611 RepID=UPI00378C96FE
MSTARDFSLSQLVDRLAVPKPAVVTVLQALSRVGINTPETPTRASRVPAAAAALREFQQRAGLPATGTADPATLTRMRDEIASAAAIATRYRTGKLHQLLSDAGYAPDAAEMQGRSAGPSTIAALSRFQSAAGLPESGLAEPATITALRDRAVTRRLGSKRQIAKLQKTLLRAARVRGMQLHIDAEEMRTRQLGPSTLSAVQALQESLRLSVTGTVDAETYDRISAIAASKAGPAPVMGRPDPSDVGLVRRQVRLNMTNADVSALHKALALLGHQPAERESKAGTFGRSTRGAVLAFQASRGLTRTGAVDRATLRELNAAVAEAAPMTALPARIRGSVRDTAWKGIPKATVTLRTNPPTGTGVELGTRTTLANGFYDLPYTPPKDAAGRPVKPLALRVTFTAPDGEPIGTKDLIDPTAIAWANYTQGPYPYAGPSLHTQHLAAVAKAGVDDVLTLIETADRHDVTRVAQLAGITQDDVMRLILARRAAAELGGQLDADVCFGFLAQSLPSTLPPDLLAETHDWTLIDQLTDRTAAGIALADTALADSVLDTALQQNLVPVTVAARRDEIRAAFGDARRRFALDQPLLAGNGTLRGLLEASTVPQAFHPDIADAFVTAGGLGDRFFTALRDTPVLYGGDAAIDDLQAGVEIGTVAKNHLPMVQLLRRRIADPADTELRTTRDMARLTVPQWEGLISDNNIPTPPGTDGTMAADLITTYARTMAAQSERVFPTVALTAEVGRSTSTRLSRTAEIGALVDAAPTLELRSVNVDAFLASNNLTVDDQTRTELRVLQRVHRLAGTAATARALLEQGLHSSQQIVALGEGELVRRLDASGVDQRTALTVFGYAEMQYAQVLGRLAEFRSELQAATPTALGPQVLTSLQRTELLGDVPDLEMLFGPVDVCDCPECASVYGPAAYLADLLRFLDAYPAETGGRSVRAVLAQRRPDLGKVHLDCANTETPLPYIDLVNEILEAAVPGAAGNTDRQTTRSADELRAAPEHIDTGAYDTLRTADAPMSSAFDLWQEQTRVFTAHLGVPRWQLMQSVGAAPAVDVAAEYFGISSHETTLIVTAQPDAAPQNAFWGFDSSRAEIAVPEILTHSRLRYPELLLMLQADWISPNPTQRVVLARPADVADLGKQTLRNLTPAALDRIHRLVRLHRTLPWDFWELDLLLRAPRIAAGTLDAAALTALHAAARLRDWLQVGAETLATWFGTLPTTGHPAADDPTDATRNAPSAYAQAWTNRSVVDPPDTEFTPPDGGSLTDHRRTALAALAVTEAELDALLDRTGTTLDLTTLSALSSWTGLARALGISITELLLLADLLGPVVADPFANPAAMLSFLEAVDQLRRGSAGGAELDHLLNARPESPLALGDDAVAGTLAALRESLRSSPAGQHAGQVAGYLSGTLRLPPAAVNLLLAMNDGAGPMADAFADPAFTARNAAGTYTTPITPAAFPRLFTAARQLAKAARVVELADLDVDGLEWLLANDTRIGALRLADLPVDAAPQAPLVTGWLALLRWSWARKALDGRAASLAAAPGSGPATPAVTAVGLIAAVASRQSPAVVRAMAGSLTGLDEGTLTSLDANAADRYCDPAFLLRLDDLAGQVRRLGVGADVAFGWAVRERGAPTEAEIAAQVRSAAKAKYDSSGWLAVVTPLSDTLRERRRDALVAHLLEHSARTEPESIVVAGKPWANPRRWSNADDLLRYFLVDVEMSACAQTSRIKQAIGSVQMFVQRALLNLERPDVLITADERADTASLDSWRQWKWMKNFRVWQANRKVFLYPENWITPELRDDKTPFFTEFEADLNGGEVTADRAETALRHYLEKVHEVGNLEVVGIHHEVEDDNPWDNLPPTTNVLHVVGRTRHDPPAYFYRTFDLTVGTWSPWERIEVDIAADQVVPVVYNRLLHLFWLQIGEKQAKTSRQPAAQQTTGTQRAPEPPKQMEIRLAWTVRRDKGWQPKRVARQVLVHPWQRPMSSYTLKPRYRVSDNTLWLDVYISMSLEFNNTQFWDPYTGGYSFATARRFDESAWPWHSSSFVFNGQVTDLMLKPIAGQYHVLDGAGVPSEALVATDSYTYVRSLSDPSGRTIKPLVSTNRAPRQALPTGMHLESGRLVNNTWTPNTGRLSVLEGGETVALLAGARAPFAVTYSAVHHQFDTAWWDRSPFFYSDTGRTYFVRSAFHTVAVDSTTTVQRLQYTFLPFQHPYTQLFMRELNRSGVDGLLNRKIQRFPEQYFPANTFDFDTAYQPIAPTAVADPTAKHDTLDFSRSGATAAYNWELFFHAPFMVACKLMANQRFAEALDWFHRIFDPTNVEAVDTPQRFWITRPFFEQNDASDRARRIQDILANIGANAEEVRAWKNNPFVPDLIARYRPVTYQKAVVMRYIDNLIAWGDQLFRGDTIETINEATLLYVLAGELLGRRPEHVPALPRPARSYEDLVTDKALDIFGNAQVEVQMENFIDRPTVVVTDPQGNALPILDLTYFGLPANGNLLAYWDTVADRLFKIRNCMNLAGSKRTLPLFEPPIDPALLIRAAAAGIDLDSVLTDTPAAASPYRYTTLVAQALELTAEVRALGERVLAVLERRDAEELARLQATNEAVLQQRITDVRVAQVAEATAAREALETGRDALQKRINHYSAQPLVNAPEQEAITLHSRARVKQTTAAVLHAGAGLMNLVPTFSFGISGFGGSPQVTASYGGSNMASSAASFAAGAQTLAAIDTDLASMLDSQGLRLRQFDANRFEADAARAELGQLEKQIIAARLREKVAEHELTAQRQAADNAAAIGEYLHAKYTELELFDWTLGQLSTVYFQAYQLAFDLARKAEAAYRFELGDKNSPPLVQFGYWDSLKKGLLAGDRLANDLRRLKTAFLDHNRRKLQATTHVSLATLMPGNLLELKTSGTTSIDVPEWVFATEHPGWFDQRLRSVAVTVPCTTGPFVGVHATLTMTAAVVRLNDTPADGFGDALNAPDARFAAAMPPVTSIATSHGSFDRGAPVNDGLIDDRYLAFEGAGAISRWTITLDPRDNAFDLSTVTDFVLTLDYEGRQGGPQLVDLARTAVRDALPTHGARLFGLDTAYPAAWLQFLRPDAGAEQVLTIPVGSGDLPYRFRHMAVRPTRTELVLMSDHPEAFEVRISPPGGTFGEPVGATADEAFGGMHHATSALPTAAALFGDWRISVRRSGDAGWQSLPEGLITHAWLLLRFGT